MEFKILKNIKSYLGFGEQKTLYGDENTGYKKPAKDFLPEEAQNYIESLQDDGLTVHVDYRRISALEKKARETTK